MSVHKTSDEGENENDCSGAYNFLLKTIQTLSKNNQGILLLDDKSKVKDYQEELRKQRYYNNVVVPVKSIVFSMKLPESSTNPSVHNPHHDPYILAVLSSQQRVDFTKLQTAANQPLIRLLLLPSQDDKNNDAISSTNPVLLFLTPKERLPYTCGFESGSVPPIGLCPSPELILLEQSLVETQLALQKQEIMDNTPTKNELPSLLFLLGGGGLQHQSLLVSLDVVLHQQPRNGKVHVCHFQQEIGKRSVGEKDVCQELMPLSPSLSNIDQEIQDEEFLPRSHDSSSTLTNITNHLNPYFVVAPPTLQQMEQSLNTKNTSILQSQWVSTVGTITAVRQMAKQLVFCDLAPPSFFTRRVGKTKNLDTNRPDLLYPWRNPNDDTPMAVQIIVGKTYCQRRAPQETDDIISSNNNNKNNHSDWMQQAEWSLRRLQPGQWIYFQGKTNVRNEDSLRNWQNKQCLDIVLYEMQLLPSPGTYGEKGGSFVDVSPIPMPTPESNNQTQTSANAIRTASQQPLPSLSRPEFLKLVDLYPDDGEETHGEDRQSPTAAASNLTSHPVIQVVNSSDSANQMARDIFSWLDNHPNYYSLVGIDAEWKPRHLRAVDGDNVHPVLLLQICVHTLNKIYLVDLQSLLRPMKLPTDSMTESEQIVSQALQLVLATPRLVKVGFQVLSDLQKMAASYPHVTAFEMVESILETSKFGAKVFQMSRIHGAQRLAMSSLNTLVEYLFHGKTLDKSEQISDWSQRPLTSSQQHYAALDTAVVVHIVLRLMELIHVDIHLEATASLPETLDGDFFPMPATTTTTTSKYFPRFTGSDKNAAFEGMMVSARFLYLDGTDDARAVERLGAKQHIGTTSRISRSLIWVATQTWKTGDLIPDIPVFANDESGIRTDKRLTKYIPSQSFELKGNHHKTINRLIGTRISKSKHDCVLALLDGHELLACDEKDDNGNHNREQIVVDYIQRSGYIELKDAVVLFVTLDKKKNYKRSYPNEWLENGSVLSWFIRATDWQGGNSTIAQKMLSSHQSSRNDDSGHVLLFVRRGKTFFLCCGRCRVTEIPSLESDKSTTTTTDDGKMVKLFLLLQDWSKLYENDNFRALVD